MAKFLDPKKTVRFVPSNQLRKDEAGAFVIPEEQQVIYLLKVPTRPDRIELRKTMMAKGARKPGTLGLLRGCRAALEKVLDVIDTDGSQRDGLLNSIDVVIEGYEAFYADIRAGRYPDGNDEAERELKERLAALSEAYDGLDQLFRTVAQAVPSFGELIADDDAYFSIFSLVAAKKFLVGWENRSAEFARDAFGVTDDALETVSDDHLAEIAGKIGELMKPTETEAKNSVSPSLMSSSQTTSPAASNSDPTVH